MRNLKIKTRDETWRREEEIGLGGMSSEIWSWDLRERFKV